MYDPKVGGIVGIVMNTVAEEKPMKNEFTAVIESAEEGGFIAYCPEVPEANGQGETKEEAIHDLRSAIELVLEDRREQGLRGIPADADTTVVTVG